MQFICGVCKGGQRRIFSAENAPSIRNLDDLTGELSDDFYDWGPDSDTASSERTACVILSRVISGREVIRLAPIYAEQVVRPSLSADRMWMLSISEIESWADAHRRVI